MLPTASKGRPVWLNINHPAGRAQLGLAPDVRPKSRREEGK